MYMYVCIYIYIYIHTYAFFAHRATGTDAEKVEMATPEG